MHRPFEPQRGSNQILSATATSASATINASSRSVRVYNSGTLPVYIRIGQGTQTATTADYYLPEKTEKIFSKGGDDNGLGYICPTGTSELHVQTGEGGI